MPLVRSGQSQYFLSNRRSDCGIKRRDCEIFRGPRESSLADAGRAVLSTSVSRRTTSRPRM